MNQSVVGYWNGDQWVPYATIYSPEQERLASLAIARRYGAVEVRVYRAEVRS